MNDGNVRAGAADVHGDHVGRIERRGHMPRRRRAAAWARQEQPDRLGRGGPRAANAAVRLDNVQFRRDTNIGQPCLEIADVGFKNGPE